MSPTTNLGPELPDADRIFADFLKRRTRNEESEFDQLLLTRPDIRVALQQLYREWKLGSAQGRVEVRHKIKEFLKKVCGIDISNENGATQPSEGGIPSPQKELLRRLAARVDESDRYQVFEAINRGGMGIVYRAIDQDLQRKLAMKVVLLRGLSERTNESGDLSKTIQTSNETRLGRFLEEAQVTSQLDHPNIVPVHNFGFRPDGNIYYTMRYVPGETLDHILEYEKGSKKGWTQLRVIEVLLRVCDALAYAHDKGVVHRDIKPSNIMVGKFGETYVLDFGLARTMEIADADISTIYSIRDAEIAAYPSGPHKSTQGQLVGTAAYMAPEQAEGDNTKIGRELDVYAVGSILYRLIARQTPYVKEGAEPTFERIIDLKRKGPPDPISALAPHAPAELVAIAEKAMARKPEDRYRNTIELADDLRAYINLRVVAAYRTGPWVEAKKWVQRNRKVAVVISLSFVLAIAGFVGFSLYRSKANRDLLLKTEDELARRALGDVVHISNLRARASNLYPAVPGKIKEMEDWLTKANELVAAIPTYKELLESLESRSPKSSGQDDAHSATSAVAGVNISIKNLEAFRDDASKQDCIPAVSQRLDVAKSIRRRTIDEHKDAWEQAIAIIKDEKRSPQYRGLEIVPQIGLIPIGVDRESGLYEFLFQPTGSSPTRADDGKFDVTPNSGVVLVLIPGGTLRMGLMDAPAIPRELMQRHNEFPNHKVPLEAFFLSKYEMTQAQWRAITNNNPSFFHKGIKLGGDNHPLEQISWYEARDTLKTVGLTLPTEAQWEYAIKAGKDEIFCSGNSIDTIEGWGNVADATAAVSESMEFADRAASFADGFLGTSPVGRFTPNRFGLYDMIGNVSEWCCDEYALYEVAFEAGTGARRDTRTNEVIFRGASYLSGPTFARSTVRNKITPKMVAPDIGIRPARKLDR